MHQEEHNQHGKGNGIIIATYIFDIMHEYHFLNVNFNVYISFPKDLDVNTICLACREMRIASIQDSSMIHHSHVFQAMRQGVRENFMLAFLKEIFDWSCNS